MTMSCYTAEVLGRHSCGDFGCVRLCLVNGESPCWRDEPGHAEEAHLTRNSGLLLGHEGGLQPTASKKRDPQSQEHKEMNSASHPN